MQATKQDVKEIISLIEQSPLDETIKDILIRDLKSEGLTEFLREQINAYCAEGLKQWEEEYKKTVAALSQKQSQSPA